MLVGGKAATSGLVLSPLLRSRSLDALIVGRASAAHAERKCTPPIDHLAHDQAILDCAFRCGSGNWVEDCRQPKTPAMRVQDYLCVVVVFNPVPNGGDAVRSRLLESYRTEAGPQP